jgi:hypothetical protein
MINKLKLITRYCIVMSDGGFKFVLYALILLEIEFLYIIEMQSMDIVNKNCENNIFERYILQIDKIYKELEIK